MTVTPHSELALVLLALVHMSTKNPTGISKKRRKSRSPMPRKRRRSRKGPRRQQRKKRDVRKRRPSKRKDARKRQLQRRRSVRRRDFTKRNPARVLEPRMLAQASMSMGSFVTVIPTTLVLTPQWR